VPAGRNVLRGTVTVGAFLGVSVQYLVRAAGGEELTVFAQNRSGNGSSAFGPGQEVLLTWEPKHTFVVKRSPEE
jgi:spermidine/putrescine transport system ATP-binding protein